MKKIIILMSLLLFSLCAPAEEKVFSLSELVGMKESELKKMRQQQIAVRGFVYKTENGSILAKQPHLQHCCVGSSNKIQEQIFLLGNLGDVSPHQPVEVKGVFHISPKWNDENELVQYFVIENPVVFMKDEPLLSELDIAILIGVFFLIAILFVAWRKKWTKQISSISQ